MVEHGQGSGNLRLVRDGAEAIAGNRKGLRREHLAKKIVTGDVQPRRSRGGATTHGPVGFEPGQVDEQAVALHHLGKIGVARGGIFLQALRQADDSQHIVYVVQALHLLRRHQARQPQCLVLLPGLPRQMRQQRPAQQGHAGQQAGANGGNVTKCHIFYGEESK